MLTLCPNHGGYKGDCCPICGNVGVVSHYVNLSANVQKLLTELADEMYDPYDCTDLQELAARAYDLGKEDQ